MELAELAVLCCCGVRGDIEYEEEELELDPALLSWLAERVGMLIEDDMTDLSNP